MTGTGGLRERKKEKAKALIQECALRLFAGQGYNATTVEQIAEAADVSASTFFRYFQTKEMVILYDSLDPILIENFRNQPKALSVIQALRRAMKKTFAGLPSEKKSLEMQRFKLLSSIPELKSAMYEETIRSIDLFIGVIAERSGTSTDDLAVRNTAGAIIGVGLASMLHTYANSELAETVTTFDLALQRLEKGLEL